MTIDTNILIAYLNGEEEVVSVLNEWKQSNHSLFISSISIAELLALSRLGPQEINEIRHFLRQFISVSLDDRLAEYTAFVQRRNNLKLPDAAVASTALINNVPLVTRDIQFRRVKELTVISI